MNSKFDDALILIKKGQIVEAKNIFTEILKLDPKNFSAYNNRGNIYLMLGDLDNALQNYDKAIKLKPDFADAYNNKGNVLQKLNKHEDAVESYQKATKFDQNHVQAYYNLGRILKLQEKYLLAIENFEKAIKLKPNYVEPYLGLGNLYLKLKKNNLALENFENAIKIKPDYNFLLGNIVHTKLKLCIWNNFDKLLQDVENKVADMKKISQPFPLLTFSNSLSLQKISAQLWTQHETSGYRNVLGPISKKIKNKKITIGYYSADFHDHATSNLMVNLFELHDRSKFEIIGFN